MLARSAIARGITGGYTPPPANDASFNNVTMLIKTSQTNGGTNNSFLDSSLSSLSITRNGNVSQGAVSPYGGRWSVQFPGNTNNYVQIPNSTLKFNASDFTIEAWINPDGPAGFILAEYRPDTGVGQFGLYFDTNNRVRFFYNFTSGNDGLSLSSASGSVLPHKWTHVAVVRSGSTLSLYINGTLASSTSVGSSSLYNASGFGTFIGRSYVAGSDAFQGYISNLRITTTAIYGSDFAVPTTNLTAVSGTQFLGFTTPYPKDLSSSNLALTWIGVSVTKFSPYARTVEYSTAAEGGSGYFDGNGDFLSFNGNTNTDLTSGDFSIEFWVKRELGAGDQVIIDSGGGQVLEITVQSNHTLYFYDGSTVYTTPASTQYLLYPGAWHHVAVTMRSDNLMGIYVNGQLALSATTGRSWTQSGWRIGRWWQGAGYDFKGYLSDIRIQKGVRAYTSAFTPPASPISPDLSSVLFLGFRNANIWDAAGMVNFETVPGASAMQVYSGTAKWDTTCAYFPNAYLQTAEKQLYNLSTADFTIELWMAWLGGGVANVLFDTRSADNNQPWTIAVTSGGIIYFYDGTTYSASTALTYNTWQHVVIERISGVLKIFLDGVLVLSTALSATENAQANICVGGTSFGTSVRYYGYIDELRITRGSGRYPSNFTPPTSQFLTK